MEKFENTAVITVELKVAHVRYAISKDGDCVVCVQDFYGMNAKNAVARVKKENKGQVIILAKTYDIVRYDIVGGTFIPSEQ